MFSVTFDDDIPLPSVNAEAYRSIYRIENWLRRIALTAYMNKYGSDWSSRIDKQLRNSLQRRVKGNAGRLYLDAESDENLIWLTMHRELHRLLLDDEVWPFVERILTVPREVLASKLLELNEIRNMLAHNRALTLRTSTILAGLCASFEAGIHRFKDETLYGASRIVFEFDQSAIIEPLRQYSALDLFRSGYQAYIEETDDLYELVCLPVPRGDRDWLSIPGVLRVFREHLSSILAFCLNVEGSEYRILLPKSLSVNEIGPIYAKFADNPMVWTDKAYVEQGDKYLHNPRIWFYRNQKPDFE